MEYIVAVYRLRHFAKAAEQCGVTQPTLSAMIQKLEAELDVKIFERSSQQVTPTAIESIGKGKEDKGYRCRGKGTCGRNMPNWHTADNSSLSASALLQ